MKKYVLSISLIFFIAVSAFAGTTETSSITAATIIAKARVHLDAVNDTDFFPDSDFVKWIDEAVRETINKTDCTETTPITKALVANTFRYDPGQSFLKVVTIVHDNGDTTDDQQYVTLDRVHINDIGHNDSTGRPQVYAVWNDQIEVWPTPRTDEASTNLYIYTVPLPTGVSATDSAIETPAYLDMALLYYVVAMGNFKNDRPDKGAIFLDLYEKRIVEYKAMVTQRKPME